MKLLADKSSIDVKSLLLFYVTAVLCRMFTLYMLPAWGADSNSIWYQLLTGAGPAVGALLVKVICKKKTAASVFGKSLVRSLACLVIPVGLLLIFDRHKGMDASLILLGCTVYAFLEETGWRGCLTGLLTGLRPFTRILLVTVLWFFWHLSFPQGLGGLVFFAVLWLASWGLDTLAFTTRSLVLCSCLHGVFNLFKHGNGLLENGLTTVILAVSVGLWFVIWFVPFERFIRKKYQKKSD